MPYNETPTTIGTIMAPKSPKSILTDMMEKADAKKNSVDTTETALTPEEIAAKRSLRKAQAFLAVSATVFAATVTSIYLSSRKQTEETEEN